MPESDLEKLTPPKQLSKEQRKIIFEHIYRRLAVHRNNSERWANYEEFIDPRGSNAQIRRDFVEEVNTWANALLKNAWAACKEPDKSEWSLAFTQRDSEHQSLQVDQPLMLYPIPHYETWSLCRLKIQSLDS